MGSTFFLEDGFILALRLRPGPIVEALVNRALERFLMWIFARVIKLEIRMNRETNKDLWTNSSTEDTQYDSTTPTVCTTRTRNNYEHYKTHRTAQHKVSRTTIHTVRRTLAP